MPLEDLNPKTPGHWPQVQLFLQMAGESPTRTQLIRTPWGLRLCFYDTVGNGVLALDLSLSEAETFATSLRSLSTWTPPP